jgi:hypothetical protein
MNTQIRETLQREQVNKLLASLVEQRRQGELKGHLHRHSSTSACWTKWARPRARAPAAAPRRSEGPRQRAHSFYRGSPGHKGSLVWVISRDGRARRVPAAARTGPENARGVVRRLMEEFLRVVFSDCLDAGPASALQGQACRAPTPSVSPSKIVFVLDTARWISLNELHRRSLSASTRRVQRSA